MAAFSATTYYKKGSTVTSGGFTYRASESVQGVAPPTEPWVQVGAEAAGTDSTFAAAKGPVLLAPNATKYRIKVANDGTLSTEVVP